MTQPHISTDATYFSQTGSEPDTNYMSDSDLFQDVDEGHTLKDHVTSIPVHHPGIVQTRSLPARNAIMRNMQIGANTSNLLVGETPQRTRLVVMSDKAVTLADNASVASMDAQAATIVLSGFILPANVALELLHTAAVYVSAQDVANVSFIHEFREG